MNAPATHQDLLGLFDEYREFVIPKKRDGIPDYTASAMKAKGDA